MSSDGSTRWKRRLLPRIVVNSDTSALGGVLPNVSIKFLGANCSADPDGVRPLLADPVQMGSYSSPRQTPSLLTGGVGDALIVPLPKSSDSVFDAAPCRSAEACVAYSHSCLYFSAEILGMRMTALLDCGASENFIAEKVAMSLGCRSHTLRTPLHVRIANGDRLLCTEFVRLRMSLSSWRKRLTFWIIPSTLPIILGIPFLTRVNPHIYWRERKMSIADRDFLHIVHSDPLLGPTAEGAVCNFPPSFVLCEPVRTAPNPLVKIDLAERRMLPSQLTCEFPFVLMEIAECAVLEELSPQEVQ